MRPGRSKDLVAAAALAGALGLGGFLFLRAQGLLGTHWTDGTRRFASATERSVRHAVWDAPERLEGLGEGSDPALSPDGRWLVFASGARGLNQELFVAELVDGVPGEAQPLSALNSPADELAPAFADGWLWFASDRAGGAGGLDLWRARYREGEFGRVEALAPGLNSAADETDPAPRPGSDALVFAANRARADFDLYEAVPDAGEFYALAPLVALNSPADERGPAFASDGRSLYFASERPGGPGGSDLFRALSFARGWQAPERVEELASARAERGPWVARDGFTLLFEREDERGLSELTRARSRELFLVAPPAVTLAQWLTLAALFVLALLALLAKRWGALDVLYKCFLVSLVLHLLLMLYLRTVAPDEARFEGGERAAPSFRVRVAPPEPAAERAGPGEPSELVRLDFAPAETRASAPAATLEAPERAAEDAPARRAAVLEPAPSAAPALQLAAPDEASARPAAPAPELALAARRTEAAHPAPTGPTRTSSEGAELAPAEPSAARLAAGEPSREALARAPGRAADLERAPVSAPAPALATPRERLERAQGTAPELTLAAAAPRARAEIDTGAPTRARLDAPDPANAVGARPAGPTPDDAPLGESLVAAAEIPAAPAPLRTPGEARAPNEDVAPALRAPVAEARPTAEARPAAPRFDALAGLGATSPVPRATPSAPARPAAPWTAEARPAAAPAPGPAPLALARAPTPRLSETPYQNRFGEQKLRALEDFGGTEESERAVAAGLAYLARIQGENGAWGQRRDAHEKYLDVRIGKSALALLAFLGAGHVPGGDTQHAATVERVVRWLLAEQDPSSGHFGRSCSYGHGIATYALAECYALTRASELRAPLEAAVARVLANQSRLADPRFAGGWGYYFADGRVWNGDEWPRTSVTAWQVMALESAQLGGLAIPPAAFAGAREFLLNTWDERRGAFRYDHDPERLSSGYPILPASTPAALFALTLLDVDPRAAELAPARRFVLTRAPDGYRYTGDDDFVRAARGNLYFWYYSTLALFCVGGREWERWNAALQATLLPAQDEDGSWRPLDVYSEYAGDEDDERTYSTAMCVLSLEIYYRYFTPLLKVR